MYSLLSRKPRKRGDTESVKLVQLPSQVETKPPTLAVPDEPAAQVKVPAESATHAGPSHARTAVTGKIKKFFGDDPELVLPAHHSSTPDTSWRNVIISFGTFLVLLYCFGVQIWIIVRSIKISQAVDREPAGKNETVRVRYEESLDSAMRFSMKSVDTIWAKLLEIPSAPPLTNSLKGRAIGQTKATEVISAACLYRKGSELAKHGDLAVFFNVLYNLWIAFFILVLFSYEHKTLRFSRKVHSACVVGLIQAWIGIDYLAKGVEVWLVLAASSVFIAAFFNLLYGLPKTHSQRYKLLPYLLAKHTNPSIPTAGRSYAVPSRQGTFLPLASDAVRALNEGIEEEQRQLKTSEANIRKMKIMKANLGPVDLVPYQTLPQTVLNPALLKGLSEEEKAKHGVISTELEKSVIGGIMPFHSIGEQYNPMEMLRSMMRPTAGATAATAATGAPGAGATLAAPKEDPTDKLIRWKMMNDLLKDTGGMDNRGPARPMVPGPYNQPYAQGIPLSQPYSQGMPLNQQYAQDMPLNQPYLQRMPMKPPAAYRPYARDTQDSRMHKYLQRQQQNMMNLPANNYSVYI